MAANKISQCYVLFSLLGIFDVLPLADSGVNYYFNVDIINRYGSDILILSNHPEKRYRRVQIPTGQRYRIVKTFSKSYIIYFTAFDEVSKKPLKINNTVAAAVSTSTSAVKRHVLYVETACVYPLGMESGKIKDSQITVSSVFRDSNTGGQARLRQNIGLFGAWCPKTDGGSAFVTKFDEYIQIDLLNLTKVMRVATQGRRLRNGTEFVKEYKISYSQDGRTWTFYPGKDHAEEAKIFQGNKHVSGVIVKDINPTVTARFIRVHPGYTKGTQVCMRLELYGCVSRENKEVILSYSMPVGQETKNGKIQYKDTSYTGVIADEFYKDGTGILTDGKFGPVKANEFQGKGWVGWSSDFTEPRYIPFIFEFSNVRKFKDVTLTINVDKKRDCAVFTRSQIFFSSDEKDFSNPSFLQYCPSVAPVNDDQYNTNITLSLCENTAKLIKMKLYFGGEWLLISEINFNSVSASANEKQSLQKCSEDSIASCSVTGTSTTPRSICEDCTTENTSKPGLEVLATTKSSNPPIIETESSIRTVMVTKNLNTPVIVAIVVSFVILFIVVCGILEYRRRHKGPQMTTSISNPEAKVELSPRPTDFVVQPDQEAEYPTPAISDLDPPYEEVQISPASVCTELDRNKRGEVEASVDNIYQKLLKQASDYVMPADGATGSYDEVKTFTPPGQTELDRSKQDQSTTNNADND